MFLFYISAVSAYTSALKSSIMYRTEFQPKLIASRTISNVKTDEIFTNLLMQDGRKALIRKDETYYSRSKELEYYGKVSGTPVKHCSEIFLGAIDDQESTNSILVVGKAGIGKSLFCQKVTRDWANNELFQARENTEIPNLKFVYLLTFRQFNLLENDCVTLREILNCCSALDDKCDIDDSTFEYIVKHPKEVMIILDGYDEYSQQDYIAGNLEEQHPNNARRKMPVAALCSKLMKGKILRGAIVMITSRPDESDKMGGIRFKRYVEIAGFSTEQVKEYIDKYFKNDENMKNAVLKHVMNNEDLVSFAHVPMLCYLLCFEMEYTLTKSENPDGLPASTTDIYNKLLDIFELKHCAESKYRRDEIPEHFKPPPVIKNTLEKLSELAAKLLVEGKPTFDESEMEGEFELEEVNKLKGSGLLYCGQPIRTALITTTKHFSFTHLTVQEFLAARWFVKENRVPDRAECSEMVFQFMAGVLSNENNEELMEKLIDLPMTPHLRLRCLKEYRDKEFVKQFMRKNPQAFFQSHGVLVFECFSDVRCVEASFLLDIIIELNKEEAGEAQHKYTDTFFTVKSLGLVGPGLTLSGIQPVCNSLKNEHCLVSLLRLVKINWSDEYVDLINRLLVRRLTTLILNDIKITDSGVARLCEALQDPSCKLTTLNLESSGINDTGVASLGEALQHPSCKLTTLYLKDDEITDSGVASLREALQHPSCKLTTLNLGSSGINDIGVASLGEALQHPGCQLTTLNLGYSGIIDTGVVSLCEALQHPSCKLTTLNLRSSGINDIGVARLGEALQHPSCKLTTLYLEGNDITDIGVASLCEALKHPNSKLTTLCISCRGIGDTCVPSLCEALQHSSCKLTTLGMQHCSITGSSVTRLFEASQHPSCKLTALELPALVLIETFGIPQPPDLKVSYH